MLWSRRKPQAAGRAKAGWTRQSTI
ncbi:protein of unknown function [Azospirillum baldaniorum]|uniref:Uncharacterized protein n=1 Tax=Azospirillum baldaniorum TaxID=1064539 RepID=A0A9P1JT86_9PROT|nr:protein of unknown function [Azospirillum baldaniorum]